eukprot:2545068-Rhodomonas_salina.1
MVCKTKERERGLKRHAGGARQTKKRGERNWIHQQRQKQPAEERAPRQGACGRDERRRGRGRVRRLGEGRWIVGRSGRGTCCSGTQWAAAHRGRQRTAEG